MVGRKSNAESNDLSTTCVHCHPNFATLTNPCVGAIMVRAQVQG
jgi:hypothetical protein